MQENFVERIADALNSAESIRIDADGIDQCCCGMSSGMSGGEAGTVLGGLDSEAMQPGDISDEQSGELADGFVMSIKIAYHIKIDDHSAAVVDRMAEENHAWADEALRDFIEQCEAWADADEETTTASGDSVAEVPDPTTPEVASNASTSTLAITTVTSPGCSQAGATAPNSVLPSAAAAMVSCMSNASPSVHPLPPLPRGQASPLRLRDEHRHDLEEKSGLSPDTIAAMKVESLDGIEIFRRIYPNASSSRIPPEVWIAAHGYAIPYPGCPGFVRYRMFWPDLPDYAVEDDDDRPQDPFDVRRDDRKLPRYLSPVGSDWHLYIPPGFDAVWARDHTQALWVTEGEKKAAKAVQEGIPCVAIAGVTMWMDPEARRRERSNGDHLSYRTPVLKALQVLAEKRRVLIAFDSDRMTLKNGRRSQVFMASVKLKDALLYQCAEWVRYLDIAAPDEDTKWGIDDFLVPHSAKDLMNQAGEELDKRTIRMTDLFKFVYDVASNGDHLRYRIPNSPKYARESTHRVLREMEDVRRMSGGAGAGAAAGAGTPPAASAIQEEVVSTTRVWISKIVEDIDTHHFNFALQAVPISKRDPIEIVGDHNILVIGQKEEDLLGRHGARILPKFKAAMEEFFHVCQDAGVRTKAVREVAGTRRRGWVERKPGDVTSTSFVLANKVINSEHVRMRDHPDADLIPIADESQEAKMIRALRARGDKQLWLRAMQEHVLAAPLVAFMLGASQAGLLRYFTPNSENFTVHLFGESSGGKSMSMIAAASSWGAPDDLIDSWRTTDNGLERKAVARNDMCLFLDEAGQQENPDVLDRSIYLISNTKEKMRATRDAKARPTEGFRLTALSNGEKQIPVKQKFGGQEVRLIELRADLLGPLWPTINNSKAAEALTKILRDNNGWAIEPMIQGILSLVRDDRNAIHKRWEAHTDCLRTAMQGTLPDIHMRRLKHFASILTALDMFMQFVMEWDDITRTDRLTRWRDIMLRHCVQLETDTFGEGEKPGMLRYLLGRLAEKQRNFLSEDRKGREVPHDVWGRIDGPETSVITKPLSELAGDYGVARLVRAAESIGALVYNPNASRGRKTLSKRIGECNPDCYVFDTSVIEDFLETVESSDNPVVAARQYHRPEQ